MDIISFISYRHWFMFCCGRCVLSSPTTLPLFVLELTIALFFICLLFSLPMSTGFSHALSPGCSLGQLDTVSWDFSLLLFWIESLAFWILCVPLSCFTFAT